MKIVEIAIKQPITVSVGVILAVLSGIVAFDRVPIQMTPEVEDTVIAVTTTWENASPQEVETDVIDEQEERLQNVENLRYMTSISQRGQGQIRLEFRTGTNKEMALREVSDKLREVPSYPLNVDEPVITDSDPESRDFIAWVTLRTTDPKFDVRTLYDYVDKRIKPRFDRLPGMAEVGIYGGREREVQIRVDPVLLAQRGITPSQFISVIQAMNGNYSGGALADGKSDIRIRAIGRFSDVVQVKNTIITQSDAGPVYIGDVAEVVETYKEPTSFVRNTGVPVIAMSFQREVGSNVIEVMKELQAELSYIRQPGGLLENIAEHAGVNGEIVIEQVYDQTKYIDQALNLVQNNIYLGGTIATITLLLFLRSLRSIGIIAIAIPISVISAITVLVALGRTMNVVSLAGMAFAIGLVVDNSIVVLENIYRHLEMGKKVARAAYDGASEVAGAVMASTLTTLIVFIPILLIEESAGQLFRDIALAICASVGISFIVAITVIPSASSLLMRSYDKSMNKFSGNKKKRVSKFIGNIIRGLSKSYVLRFLVVAFFIILTVGGTILLMPPIDYLPMGNRNIVFGILNPPPGYNLDQLLEIGNRIEKRMRPAWEAGRRAHDEDGNLIPFEELEVNIPTLESRTEETVERVPAPPLEHYFMVGTVGRMFHGGLCSYADRVIDLVPLFQYATAEEVTPGIRSFAFQMPVFRIAGRTGSAVNIDLVGPDLSLVTQSANIMFGKLTEKYGVFSVQPEPDNFNIPAPELNVLPDYLALTDLGLTVRDLGLTVQVNSDGAFVGDYDINGEMVDLKVIADDAVNQTSIDGLKSIPIAGPDGKIVTLESVGDLVRTTEPEQIKRVGRQRAVTLQFTPPRSMPLQEAIEEVNHTITDLKQKRQIDPSVEAQLSGSASKLDAMQTALLGDGTLSGFLASSLFLALLVVYLLMCVLFQSWIYPFVIMMSVPLATFGGFLALAIVHQWSVIDRYMPIQNLDVLTILGFVILAGVVVNNAILIVHQTLNFLSGRSQMDVPADISAPQEAIAQSVESRVRPILMSTLTSVGGMMPLVLMPGSGSELYRGLGSVMVGGLLVSTFFTLFLVPVLLSLMFNFVKEIQTEVDI